jgi:hypothetical protein
MTGSIIKKHQPSSKERHHPRPDPSSSSDKLSSPSIKKDEACLSPPPSSTAMTMKTRRGPGRPPKTVVIAADKEDKVKTVVVVAKPTAKVAVARRCSSPPDIRLNSISELTGGRPSACDRDRAVFDLIKKLRGLEIETVEVNKRLSDEREAIRVLLNKFIEE